VGTIVQDGNVLKFEMGLVRSKLQGFLNTGMKIGVSSTKSDWSAIIGAVPDEGSPSFYLDMTE
jgi:hypothetical protein